MRRFNPVFWFSAGVFGFFLFGIITGSWNYEFLIGWTIGVAILTFFYRR